MPPRVLIDRFLVAGEGRTDQIAGYLDGLAIWKRFFEAGVSGVIRGDEPGWGYGTVHSDTYVRRRAHLDIVPDYPQNHLIRRLGLAPQALPDWALRRPDESLMGYRDRLYEGFSFPMYLAPLSDVKCAYVELVNPLQTDRVVRVARELPEALRSRVLVSRQSPRSWDLRCPWRSARRSPARARCWRRAGRSPVSSWRSSHPPLPSGSLSDTALTGSSPRSASRAQLPRGAGYETASARSCRGACGSASSLTRR